MKMLLLFVVFSVMSLVFFKASHAQYAVWCTNCSEQFTQALDRITNIEKLHEAYKQVSEAIKQTEQQIEMVQQGIKKYENMVRNTMSLPGRMRGMMQGTFSQLSSLTQVLNVNRGDAQALSQIFREVYKSRGTISGLFKSSSTEQGKAMTEEERMESEAAFQRMRSEIEAQNEQAQEAAFQESGSQINEIEQKAAELDSQLNDLLTTPDGQMKALEAGNQIASLQLRESQRLRQLLALSVQSSVQRDMKNEKEKQMQEEAWKSVLATDKLESIINSTPDDPF